MLFAVKPSRGYSIILDGLHLQSTRQQQDCGRRHSDQKLNIEIAHRLLLYVSSVKLTFRQERATLFASKDFLLQKSGSFDKLSSRKIKEFRNLHILPFYYYNLKRDQQMPDLQLRGPRGCRLVMSVARCVDSETPDGRPFKRFSPFKRPFQICPHSLCDLCFEALTFY